MMKVMRVTMMKSQMSHSRMMRMNKMRTSQWKMKKRRKRRRSLNPNPRARRRPSNDYTLIDLSRRLFIEALILRRSSNTMVPIAPDVPTSRQTLSNFLIYLLKTKLEWYRYDTTPTSIPRARMSTLYEILGSSFSLSNTCTVSLIMAFLSVSLLTTFIMGSCLTGAFFSFSYFALNFQKLSQKTIFSPASLTWLNPFDSS